MQKTSRQDLVKSYNELMELLSYEYDIKLAEDELLGINKKNKKKFVLCKDKGIGFEPIVGLRGYELLSYLCEKYKNQKAQSHKSSFSVDFVKFTKTYLQNIGRDSNYFFIK